MYYYGKMPQNNGCCNTYPDGYIKPIDNYDTFYCYKDNSNKKIALVLFILLVIILGTHSLANLK